METFRLRSCFTFWESDEGWKKFGFTPADMNYLFGTDVDERASFIFHEDTLDFDIEALTDDDNDYARGITIAICKKLDGMGFVYNVRSEFL